MKFFKKGFEKRKDFLKNKSFATKFLEFGNWDLIGIWCLEIGIFLKLRNLLRNKLRNFHLSTK